MPNGNPPPTGIVSTVGLNRITNGTGINDAFTVPKNYYPYTTTKRLAVYHHGVGELCYSPVPNFPWIAAQYPMASSDEGTASPPDYWAASPSITSSVNLQNAYQANSASSWYTGIYPAVKTGKAFHIGYSMGGLSALVFAAHNPASVAAVFVGAPTLNLGNLWNPATSVASPSNGGNITNIASWSFPSAGTLSLQNVVGLTNPLAASGSFPGAFNGQNPLVYVVCSGGTAAVQYTGVTYSTTGSVSTGTLTGCTYNSGLSTGTPTTVSTGASVAYSRVAAQILPNAGQFTAGINTAYGGTYVPSANDPTYNGTTVNGVTFTTQQSARDVFYMGCNYPQLFSTFPIVVWYGQADVTCNWNEIEAWATIINNYCTANSLPPTVSLVAGPYSTHPSVSFDCYYALGQASTLSNAVKIGGSTGTSASVAYQTADTVLATLANLN